MSFDRKCQACGCPLKFVKNEAGKIVPLDVRAPVYEMTRDFTGQPVAKLAEGFHVSHFSTCTKASEFSKKGGR